MQEQRLDSEVEGALRARVMKAINDVLDPCSEVASTPIGLVDMGMIESVQLQAQGGSVNPAWHAEIRFGLTEPGCMMAVSLMPKIRQAVLSVKGVSTVQVNLLPDFVWNPTQLENSLKRYSHQSGNLDSSSIRTSSQPIHFFLSQRSPSCTNH
jgi:metal-sulfur cluster biosynthetic enzyme